MKLFNNLNKQHYILLAIWLIANIVQSFFTNLHPDETYYWLYSQNLACGYFDHPPMVAFLIHLGDSIMHNELGVRLLFVLISTLTIALIMNEINEKKDLFFMSLFILSFPLTYTHIGGFLALPDTPLVFLTLLFFVVYRQFANAPGLKLAAILSLIAALMIYSKYHSFLVLAFIVLSNLKLLRNKYFWIVIGGTLVLLIPHILWQIENHFPTILYHLSSRTKPVQMRNIINNLYSQLLIAGPLTGAIVLYNLKSVKTKGNPFNRAALFSILGFYIVFTIMSFWNRIEAHWTTAATPLLMIVTYPAISGNEQTKKWFKRLALPIVVLFFIFKIYIAIDAIPNIGYLKYDFYKIDDKAKAIKKLSNNLKVGSFNNYNMPGTYEFYTGEPMIHLATPDYRFCQFDLWDGEQYLQGDSVFAVLPGFTENGNNITLPNKQKINTVTIPQFQSLKHLTLKVISISKTAEKLTLSVEFTNKSDHTIFFNHPSTPLIGSMKHKKEFNVISIQELTSNDKIEVGKTILINYSIPVSSINGSDSFVLFVKSKYKYRGEMIAVKINEFTTQ